MRGAWANGYNARKDGESKDACPYQSRFRTQWLDGWKTRYWQEFVRTKMRPNSELCNAADKPKT